MTSFKPEVQADTTGTWSSNAVRFATEQEAKDYVHDLSMRWTAVRETRVVESDDPVTCRWNSATQMTEWLPEEGVK